MRFISKAGIMGVATSVVMFLSPAIMQFDAASAATSDTSVPATETQFEQTCETTSTDDMEKQTCTDGHAKSTSKASDITVDKLKINGHIAGEYIVEGGLTKKMIGDAYCYVSHSGYNSMRDSSGNINFYYDTRPQKICNTGNGPTGWQVVKCGNFYKPNGKPPKRYKIVRNPVVVQSLDKYTLHGKVRATSVSEAWATSSATATCASSTGSGSAEAYARSEGVALLRFTFKGLHNAQATGNRVVEEHQLQLNIEAYAKVKTEAAAKATADATCSGGPSTPSTPAPTFVAMDTINDVLINNTYPLDEIKGTVAAGHTALLHCSALNGGSIIGGNDQTVSGNFTAAIVTYRAPSEAPTANSQYGIAAGFDRVRCTLSQDDGQTAQSSTNDFRIKVPNPDPA